MTPCDSYAKWHESHYVAALDMYVHRTKCPPDTKYKKNCNQIVLPK